MASATTCSPRIAPATDQISATTKADFVVLWLRGEVAFPLALLPFIF
jgi:hypothetical protein